jgi:hypothetical protein
MPRIMHRMKTYLRDFRFLLFESKLTKNIRARLFGERLVKWMK